jgi:SAM-dependent methyltransferase
MVRRGPDKAVEEALGMVEAARRRVEEMTAMRLEGKRILEIGPGQQLRTMRCLSVANEVTGIDMDVVAQRLTPGEFARMVRSNPPMRTLKTLVRKALGHDARFEARLASAQGVERFRTLPVLRMDAARMDFADGAFDFVCSFLTFQHIEDPEGAIRETRRVLAPGGVAYILTHLWTSNSGHNDPRIVAGELPPPYWPHLRPGLQQTVQYATYCNRLRLGEWRAMFSSAMPGVRFVLGGQSDLADALRELRTKGDLPEYDDEELLNSFVVAIWQKPTPAPRESAGELRCSGGRILGKECSGEITALQAACDAEAVPNGEPAPPQRDRRQMSSRAS